MSRPPQLMITYVDMPLRRVSQVGPLKVLTYPAVHTNETNSTSLQVEVASKVIAYTGDSEWTEHMP